MSRKKLPIWKRLTIMIVSGFIGAATVTPLAIALKSSRSPILEWLRDHNLEFVVIVPGLLLTYVACFVAAVAAHEIGHVVAGLHAGFRFAFLLFWPFQIRRRGKGGLSVKMLFRSGLGLGGLAGMTPGPGIDLRKGYLTLIAGGPLTSLTCGVFAAVAFVVLRTVVPLAAAIVCTFAAFNLVLFLISMTPSHAGGFLSDGAAIRLLRIGTPNQVDPYIDAMAISSAWSTGTRPAEWNAEAIERLVAVSPDDPLSNRAPFFAFLHAADQGNLDEAGEWMNRLLYKIDDVPMLLQPQYRLMNAWLQARTGDSVAARETFAKARGGLIDKCEFAMVEAVILQAEGDYGTARERAKTALEAIETSMMPDAHSFARHQCESILS
jgi:hypothetical protein